MTSPVATTVARVAREISWLHIVVAIGLDLLKVRGKQVCSERESRKVSVLIFQKCPWCLSFLSFHHIRLA